MPSSILDKWTVYKKDVDMIAVKSGTLVISDSGSLVLARGVAGIPAVDLGINMVRSIPPLAFKSGDATFRVQLADWTSFNANGEEIIGIAFNLSQVDVSDSSGSCYLAGIEYNDVGSRTRNTTLQKVTAGLGDGGGPTVLVNGSSSDAGSIGSVQPVFAFRVIWVINSTNNGVWIRVWKNQGTLTELPPIPPETDTPELNYTDSTAPLLTSVGEGPAFWTDEEVKDAQYALDDLTIVPRFLGVL